MKKDLNQLIEQYKPLILGTYKKFHNMLNNPYDKEDLMATINEIFVQLVREYDARRGVDFPLYVKKMIHFRTYHFIQKTYKVQNKESLIEGLTDDKITLDNHNEYHIPEEYAKIVNKLSWNGDLHMGKKQEKVFTGLLQGKSIRQLAVEEGVKDTVIHSRLHSIIKKLEAKNEYQRQLEEKYGF